MKSKILLIGIDGLILATALNSGRAPTLSTLRGNCSFTQMEMALPTVSGPGWATLLTGSTIAEHGVLDNDFVGHTLNSRPDFLTQAFLQDGESVTFAAAGWPPLIDPDGIGPVIRSRSLATGSGAHQGIARDGESYGYLKVDSEVADLSVQAIAEVGPDLSFIYFCGADEAAHLYGVLGKEYLDAINRIDDHLARLLAAVKIRSELGERWLVVITTDHGHVDEGGHGEDSPQERASFVIASGVGRANPEWPAEFSPETLTPLLLDERAE